MDVALDTNILIRDLWLRSQSMRLLFDYIDRTNSRLLISDIVMQELEAYFKRNTLNDISNINRALQNAKQHFVEGLPEINNSEIYEATYTKWYKKFELIKILCTRIIYKTNPEFLADAINRSIERVPPCKETGEGMRDAIIWLSFIDFCKHRLKSDSGYQVAFISENVRDFANITRDNFHPRLQADIDNTGAIIEYYSSLDAFIDKQAKPISHITVEWVNQRIDNLEIEKLVIEFFQDSGFSWKSKTDYFVISDDKYRKYFKPSGKINIYQIDANLEGVQVYEFDDQHVEVSLDFYIYLEADVECQRVTQIFEDFEQLKQNNEEIVITPMNVRSFVCISDLRVFISANINGDVLEILDIEEIDRS